MKSMYEELQKLISNIRTILLCKEELKYLTTAMAIIYTNLPNIMSEYTECPGGYVPDFGRMFLTLKYTDLTQNTLSEVERLRR